MSIAPSVTNPAADRLRARAGVLRALAARLEHLRALDLYRDAGPDTWVGPSPQRCGDSLRSVRTALLEHADELIRTAHRFERQADQMVVDANPAGRS